MATVEIVDRSEMRDQLASMLTLEPEKSAIVTIDMHRGHLDPEVATMPASAEDAERVIKAAEDVIDFARVHGVPIVHVKLVYRKIPGLGSEGMRVPFWKALHDIQDEKNKLDEEGGKIRHQSKARVTKARRGRPTQRKRYTRRGSYEQRPKQKDVQTETINSNESSTGIPSSQSSKVTETHQIHVDFDGSRKLALENLSCENDSESSITGISQPDTETRINTEP